MRHAEHMQRVSLDNPAKHSPMKNSQVSPMEQILPQEAAIDGFLERALLALAQEDQER